MKKTYTILFLSITILTFAQNNKVEKTSKEGYYFKQVGDKIEVWRGYPSNNAGYSFREVKGAETIEVVANNRGGVPPASSFSSPNEVKVTQDAAGNKYWTLIDGTVVKTELASKTSPVKTQPKTTNKEISKEPVKTAADKSIISAPAKEVQKASSTKTQPKTTSKEISKEPVKTTATDKSIIPAPAKEVQKASSTKAQPKTTSKEISKEPVKPATVDKNIIPAPVPTKEVQKTSPAEVVAKQESKDSTNIKEEKSVQTQTVVPNNSETKTLLQKPEKIKDITIEELDTPSKKEDQIDINIDPNEEIQVKSGDVGNVTDLFEKNYENMTNKEKKEYRKNEKKIMKQLEEELKKQKEEKK